MDIRLTQTVSTSGVLIDPIYRVDSDISNIDLLWDETNKTLGLVDYNLDYNDLPFQLYDELVKKTFLTYNGKAKDTSSFIETVLTESNSAFDPINAANYANSNEWHYKPSEFQYPTTIRDLTDPSDYTDKPYDVSRGFTVVKQFLTAGGSIKPGDPMYTAFYRAPQITSFIPANVESNKIYTDGWYTSYIALVKTWAIFDPVANGVSKGDILYYKDTSKFYISTTGVGSATIPDPADPTKQIPNPLDWSTSITFADWTALMKKYLTSIASVNDPIYFIESQHLVTLEINKAITKEVLTQCYSCQTHSFKPHHIADYQRLLQKRLGAWKAFVDGNYDNASCILESARKLCHNCLYHKNECNTI
jgi:hypothetical protein